MWEPVELWIPLRFSGSQWVLTTPTVAGNAPKHSTPIILHVLQIHVDENRPDGEDEARVRGDRMRVQDSEN